MSTALVRGGQCRRLSSCRFRTEPASREREPTRKCQCGSRNRTNTEYAHNPSPSARCCPLAHKDAAADVESARASLTPPATALLPSPAASIALPAATSVSKPVPATARDHAGAVPRAMTDVRFRECQRPVPDAIPPLTSGTSTLGACHWEFACQSQRRGHGGARLEHHPRRSCEGTAAAAHPSWQQQRSDEPPKAPLQPVSAETIPQRQQAGGAARRRLGGIPGHEPACRISIERVWLLWLTCIRASWKR